MRYVLNVALLAACLHAQAATYGHNGKALLPDPTVTPGAVRTTDAAQVCGVTTKQFRNTTAKTKAAAYAEYNVVPHVGICKPGGCEVDHLISLELGGADEIANLWPQPYLPNPGAHTKDAVEDRLHKMACTDKSLSLKTAQDCVAKDWVACGVRIGLLPAP